MSKRDYYVEWRIDIIADSPEEAAWQALQIQRDPESTATVFHVATDDGFVEVDPLSWEED